MRYYQQIVVVALLMQLVVLSWARTRFIPDPWPVSSPYWNQIDEGDNAESNSNSDNEFLEKALPLLITKKSFRSGFHFGNEDRRKKYLGDTANFQGGHSLQGLWAMPGRR